jgi:hypothetical protein
LLKTSYQNLLPSQNSSYFQQKSSKMASPIPCLSQFNLLLVLLVVMTPKFPFTKSKKRKTKEQLRREHSSTGADPERIPRLSLYPTSFDLTRKNPAAGDSSSQPPPQHQENFGASSSRAITRTMTAIPLGPPAKYDFKFSGQKF